MYFSSFVFSSEKQRPALFYEICAERLLLDGPRVEERTRDLRREHRRYRELSLSLSLKSILKMLKALAVFKYSMRKKMQPTAEGRRRISRFRGISLRRSPPRVYERCVALRLCARGITNDVTR